LRQLLDARGHLEILEACDYVIQACEALAEAHARGIIHRDIKPENLFLVERSEGWRLVKVLDFGISKAALTGNALGPSLAPRSGASAFNTSAIMGSPHYMSPEQLRSTADVDHRADIWSIGAVLFELLTGHTAFEGSGSLADLIATILEHPAPGVREIRVDVPEGLEAIVKRCLERDRALRYPNAAELAIALLPFAPRRARLAADRALSVTREAGLSDPHLQLPPSMAPPAPDSVTTNPKIAANGDVTATSKKFEASSPRAKNYRALGLMAAIGFGVGAALFGALVVFHKHKPADSPPIATTLASVPTTIPADPAPSASTPSIATTTTPIASTSATTAPTSTHEVHATTTIKHPSSAHPTATSHSNPDLEIRTTR
jgi:serine/threonine protein kinase